MNQKEMGNKLKISESELHAIINECVKAALNESSVDEGFLNNLKGAVQGAIQGYTANKQLDDTSKENRAHFDKMDPNSRLLGPDRDNRDTAEQVKNMYNLARKYQSMAAMLYSRANSLVKYAGLSKVGSGKDAKFTYNNIHSAPATAVGGLSTRHRAGQAAYSRE